MLARVLPILLALALLPALAGWGGGAPLVGGGSALAQPASSGGTGAWWRSASDTIIRVDTIIRGDSIVRIDTILAGDTAVGDTAGRRAGARDTVSTDTIPDPPEIEAPDTLPPILLEEMVVDILRAPMALEAVPFAVSVLDEELWTTGRSDGSIEEALQGMPGVQIYNRYNDAVGERISIRGFGARSQFGVRGIKILVDGIPATLPDGQATLDHLDLGSLGRVEALRGPGSALYGNAAGGVLNFETREPAESPLRQEVRWIEGAYDYRRRQSTTSGRLGRTGYFVNIARYEFGGYRTNPLAPLPSGPDEPRAMFGSAVRDHLNAQLTTPLLDGRLRLTANAMQLDAENPGSLSGSQLSLGDRRAFPFNVQQASGKEALQRQLGLRWDGSAGARELEVVAYGVERSVSNPGPASWMDLDRFAGGGRATLRSEFVGDEGRLWWAIGVDADLQNDHRTISDNDQGVRGAVEREQREEVRSGAVFIQAMLPINEMIDVLTGLRYDRIRFSARDLRADPLAGSADDEEDASGGRTLDSASPSFGFHAGFHPGFRLYLNLTTAFETPTTTEFGTRPDGSPGFNPDLEPQVGITTEIGGRGVLASRLAWEAVFFHTTLHNELIPYEMEGDPGQRFFRNSGRSTREGWEVTLQYTPNRLTSLRLVSATNNARFRSFEVNDVDLSGNRVPGLAPYKLEGIFRLTPGRWFGEVRAETTGPIAGSDANDPEARSPSYRLVDVRAGANELQLLGLRMSPFAGVTNLFDREYNTSVVVNALGGRHFEPGPGRAFYMGASIAAQF